MTTRARSSKSFILFLYIKSIRANQVKGHFAYFVQCDQHNEVTKHLTHLKLLFQSYVFVAAAAVASPHITPFNEREKISFDTAVIAYQNDNLLTAFQFLPFPHVRNLRIKNGWLSRNGAAQVFVVTFDGETILSQHEGQVA